MVSPAWNQFGKPLLGTVDPATDANRQGWLDDESLRHATHLTLPQHANETLAMSNSRACLHVRENGIGNLAGCGKSRPIGPDIGL